MKKSFYVAAMAGLIFSACSNETYLGGDAPQVKNDGAIGFGTKTGAITRANVGLESSVKNFRVYGVKHYESKEDSSLVFDNYLVRYTEAKTTTNSSNWEYVGIYDLTTDPKLLSDQTIKYWDYSAESYTFWALADGADKAQFVTTTSSPYVTLENGAPRKLNITGVEASDDDANNVLFTYGQTVKRSDYNKPVVLKFRRLASKVRLGFYETIPGYSVSDVKFYQGASSPDVSVVLNGKFITKADYELIYNNAKGTVTSTASNQTTGTSLTFATTGLNLSKTAPTISVPEKYILSATPTPILTSAAEPTYADHAGKGTTYSSDQYMCVLPNENQADSAYIKVDFILTSEDGKEQIKVTGATATIPADYMKWKPNYAYTYLFKISDQVNGTTGHGQTADEKMEDLKEDFNTDPFGHDSSSGTYGQDDKGRTPDNDDYGKDGNGKKPGEEGYNGSITDVDRFNKFKEDWIDAQKSDEHALYAITFDAVIEDVMDGQQGTVTTVSQPSITTYQDGSLVGAGIAYKAGEIEVKTNVEVDSLTVKNITDSGADIDIKEAKKFTAEAGKTYQITAATTAGVTVTKLIEISNN